MIPHIVTHSFDPFVSQIDTMTFHRNLHPRPQLTRDCWYDLCGTWDFAYDDSNRGLRERWYTSGVPFPQRIEVPYPPESPLSGIQDTGLHKVVWYRRSFDLSAEMTRGRLLLHFGAVDYSAKVWLNGQVVAEHVGGNTPFTADLTDALDADRPQQWIVVRAEDDPQDVSQPRGKQYWHENPTEIWYHRTTGIWQTVWLEPVSETYVERVRWTPLVGDSSVVLDIRLSQYRPHTRVKVEITFEGVTLCNDVYECQGRDIQRQIRLPLDRYGTQKYQILWSPEHPHLLDVTLTLLDDDGLCDRVCSYFGMRSVHRAQGKFWLNSRPYYLRMILEQGYYPESHLAAPDDDALRTEVQWIKTLGFNGVRVHQKVEDPRFLYWCDRLGLVVWGEMANAYTFSADAAATLTREWLEIIERDYSHPCIVAWVPINESWGVPDLPHSSAEQSYIRALTELTRTLDTTRLVLGNEGWEFIAGDIIGIHDYNRDVDSFRKHYSSAEELAFTLSHRTPGDRPLVLDTQAVNGQPVMLTEFGGISLEANPDCAWHAYDNVTSRHTFVERYAGLINAIYQCELIAGFCYTQLTDTGQETNGLLDAYRRPKVDPTIIAAINLRQPYTLPNDRP